MLEIELGEPLPAVAAIRANTEHYHFARTLVRLHTQPIGLIDLALSEHELSPRELAEQIWSVLGPQIQAALHDGGLAPVDHLSAAGIPPASSRRVVDREMFLARAPMASVIIPTRDRPDQLAICLDSVLASEYPEFEIIVVDNAPKTSATADLVRDRYESSGRIRYVREDRSGSSAARNRGLAVARGDVVAFTDDDVIVDRHWLAALAKGFTVADNVACVTGLILPLELETPAQLWFEQYGGFSKGFVRRVYDLKANRPDNPIYPYNAGGFGSGNSMAFKRSILARIGNFDPTLGNGTPSLGGVDVEAFLRVIIKGYRLVYEPAAIVHHLHRRDYEGVRSQVYNYGVGLTALLTKTLLANPRLVPHFIRTLPAGLRFALRSDSSLNRQKESDYPAELTRLDRLGMLYGPVAYIRSWLWWNIGLVRHRGR